jgi:choline-sulfatase
MRRRTAHFAFFILHFTVAVLVAACAAKPGTPPNILLITLDTTRADHLGAYGDARARTPHLDTLAAGGVLFEHAVAAAPITLPAHVSLLTGRYPFAHGVRNNGTFSLDDRAATLATVLHDRGYRTGAFVSAFVLDRRFGLARGFDRYDDGVDQAATPGGEVERRGDRTAAAAAEWIAEQAGVPFFVWLHLYDPHDPYDPPSPYREAFADRLYDGEIAFDDAVVGRLLDRLRDLGLAASTIVAVVGDHGESLGEHDEITHAMFVYESAIRVPMLVSWSGHLPAGRRIRGVTRAIDLAPTLLDLAGQPALVGAEGRTLARSIAGGERSSESAYSETYFPLLYMNWAPLRSIQDGRWKFIDAPAPELFDLETDPGERTNLASREPARAAALARALTQLTGGAAGAMTERKLDRATVEKLAALGYIGAVSGDGASPPSQTGQPDSRVRPDPKAMIAVFNDLRQANAEVRERRPAEGERLARQALGVDPQNAFAVLVVAQAEMDQGRWADAVADFRRYARLVPSSADAHHRAAICLSRQGDIVHAIAEEDAALAIDPRDAEAHELRGGLLAGDGRIAAAIPDLRSAVDLEPKRPAFHIGLARVLIDARRLDEAQGEIDRALALAPDHADALAANGALQSARGRYTDAAAAFARALAVRPDYDDVRLDYAIALEQIGRRSDAVTEFRRLASAPRTPETIRAAARRHLR